MSVQRYDWNGAPHDDGPVVKAYDHEAAVAEAYQRGIDERDGWYTPAEHRKAVESIVGLHREEWIKDGYARGRADAAEEANDAATAGYLLGRRDAAAAVEALGVQYELIDRDWAVAAAKGDNHE